MTEEPREEQVAWNLSSSLIMEIANLLQRSSNNYLTGNITKAFWSLKAIKLRIIQSLNLDERKEFKKLEEKMINARSEQSDSNISLHFEEYNELLMDKLEKYGYTISKKEDMTKMNA